ncbi:M4 family metallopeptidase [Marisediminicola senii]|uniref:M4 family metallopeptidase n=1 Tax=Marisediminicola senii TaxID=2711233 RepID=UPI0013EE142F|nr:M4 family metallopeptidase [Marisediminicola senii]
MSHFIVPPYLLQHLTTVEDPEWASVADAARRSLALDGPMRGARAVRPGETPPTTVPRTAAPGRARQLLDPERTIFDAQGTETLPGVVVRSEGDPQSDDIAVTEAYDGLGHTHALFRDAFGRASIDDDNLPLLGTVHFGQDYENAFWDGERMVFGDGDGMVFVRFTASLSVIGHELAHGVTQYTANLRYQGQSGALNESVSDVFGAMVEQYALGQTVDEASWLIGEGLFTDRVQGSALRSMIAPGTAYDDDVLGKDPQPASMADYVDTKDDNGGVHINSGIPNRAFCLAATAIGGRSWEGAGHIWYDSLVSGQIRADTDFTGFAIATITAANDRFGAGSSEAQAVGEAWTTVGVEV